MKTYIGFLLLIIGVSMPLFVSAHGDGASFEKQSGAYLVDIGYDPAPPVAGRYTLFDFNILHVADNTEADFSHVWVRVLDGENVLLATGVHRQQFGATTMLFAFPQSGVYTLEASFRNDAGEVASASFEVPVSPPEGGPLTEEAWFLPAIFMTGVISATVILYVTRRRVLVGKSV